MLDYEEQNFPSVLTASWFGNRKGSRPVKVYLNNS